MATSLDILNNVITATKDQYKLYYNTECTDADELVDYAGFIGGNSNFQIWDEQYDNDHIASNNISKSSYYASGNDLLFQTQADAKNLTNTVSLYDLSSQSMKTLTDKSEIFNLLNNMNGETDDNTLTDSKNQTVSLSDFTNNSNINVKLTRDGFEFTGVKKSDTVTTTPTVTTTQTATVTPTPTVTTTETVTVSPTTTKTCTATTTVTASSTTTTTQSTTVTVTPTVSPTSTTSLDTRGQCQDLRYTSNGNTAFFLNGNAGDEYLQSESDEMKIIAQLGEKSDGSTVISDEAIELKGSGITVVGHTKGQYDVYQTDASGKSTLIMDETGAKVTNAATILKNAGVVVNFSTINKAPTLTVTYEGKTAKLQLYSTNINDFTATDSDDTGIKSQVAAIIDKMTEKNTDGVITTSKGTYTYDVNEQNLVQDSSSATSNPDRKLTSGSTARATILADLAKIDTDGTVDGWITTNGTKSQVSLASAFSSSSGYTAAEFNEVVAKLLYSADSKFF